MTSYSSELRGTVLGRILSGESAKTVAREAGVPYRTVRDWVAAAREGRVILGPGQGKSTCKGPSTAPKKEKEAANAPAPLAPYGPPALIRAAESMLAPGGGQLFTAEEIAELEEAKRLGFRQALDLQIEGLILDSITAIRAISRQAARRDWLQGQSARELGLFGGIWADKVFRLLSALVESGAGGPDSDGGDAAGESTVGVPTEAR